MPAPTVGVANAEIAAISHTLALLSAFRVSRETLPRLSECSALLSNLAPRHALIRSKPTTESHNVGLVSPSIWRRRSRPTPLPAPRSTRYDRQPLCRGRSESTEREFQDWTGVSRETSFAWPRSQRVVSRGQPALLVGASGTTGWRQWHHNEHAGWTARQSLTSSRPRGARKAAGSATSTQQSIWPSVAGGSKSQYHSADVRRRR